MAAVGIDNIDYEYLVAYFRDFAVKHVDILHNENSTPPKIKFAEMDDSNTIPLEDKLIKGNTPYLVMKDFELSIDASNSSNVFDDAHLSILVLQNVNLDVIVDKRNALSKTLIIAKEMVSKIINDYKLSLGKTDRAIVKFIDLSSFQISKKSVKYNSSIGWELSFKVGAPDRLAMFYDEDRWTVPTP